MKFFSILVVFKFKLNTKATNEYSSRDIPCIVIRPGRGSSVGIATRYGLDGPGIEFWWGAGFSAAVQNNPWAYPGSSTYKMGIGSFPGVKCPGRGVHHPLPSSAEVKERVEVELHSPSGP